MSEQTVGKASYDLSTKNEKVDHSADEQMREQLADYEKNFQDCLQSGKATYNGTFYIVVITKKERLMENVLRNYFFHRSTCPTPEYDQAVYICRNGTPDFLWVLPAKDVCYYLRDNALEVHPDEKQLLHYVIDFFEGTLFKKALLLNGELKEELS